MRKHFMQEVLPPCFMICRALFERATHLHLPAKKMKFLFKRWLDFEKAQGNAEGVEHVKKSAMAFVESVGQS